MIVTVFRSRLGPEARPDYNDTAMRLGALAQTMPGYVSHKVFTAEDGERVTIVEFDSEDSHNQWRNQTDHVAAKKRGRESFYSEYKIQVCSVLRESAWRAKATNADE